MNKLEMAHDWYLKHAGGADSHMGLEISLAWKYADAMQKEADDREKSEVKKKIKAFRELLNADNTFVKKEGMHFDDVEWQPDWSKAPDWAMAWTLDKNSTLWWSDIPEKHGKIWFIDGGIWECADAPSFNYVGDWRDSLRKRP